MNAMRKLVPLVLLGLFWTHLAIPQTPPATTAPSAAEEFFDIYTEHPRLFLPAQRLRLLRREVERRTMRWLQFETLVLGGAPMPEPGFAYSLFYRVSDNESIGRKAVTWALSAQANPKQHLRQLALVYDWCQALLAPAQAKAVEAKLERGLHDLQTVTTVDAIRSRTLAAMVLAGKNKELSRNHLTWLVQTWWRGQMAVAIKAGRDPFTRDEAYPLIELMHAVRDNLQIDLRESAANYFKNLPLNHLISYYPASFPAAENEYRIPATKALGEPDVVRAGFSRASELAMVAYEVNAAETQVLQGWLMHDRFLLRGTLGIPYEFLWANPYHPGLSYYHIPLLQYDDAFGRLYVRSSWEDDASWVGYFDGQMQRFENGMRTSIKLDGSEEPLYYPDAVVVPGFRPRFDAQLDDGQTLFMVGMKGKQRFDVEIDDHEMFEVQSDIGGVARIPFPMKRRAGVRIHPAGLGGVSE
jgi:hypothetical protein